MGQKFKTKNNALINYYKTDDIFHRLWILFTEFRAVDKNSVPGDKITID